MKSSFKLHSLIFVLSLCSALMVAHGQSRTISVINDSWKFRLFDDPNSYKLNFDDSNWETVAIPHTWNNYDGQDGGGNYYRGTGWYRKSFHLGNISGKCIFLKFNSANLSTEVYVNGTLVGNHIGGYSAFIFNITDYVIQGSDNLIAVKVSNDASLKFAPLAGDFTFFGGITKSVELWITGNVLISPLDYASPGVYITPSNISQSHADIHVKVLLANYSNANATITEKYTIKDAHNTTVNSLNVNSTVASESESTVSHKMSINNPVFWQGLKNPNLYTLEISLTVNGNEVDRLTQKFGVRYLDSNPDSGIYLNGKRYPLHGVAIHEDRMNKGRAISDRDRKEDLELIKETGLNFLRLAHYQHGQYTYNYCDSTGIVLWTEIPLLEKIDISSSAFSANIKEQLKELIKQNYNHPSVCFWGLFNEIETQTSSPDALQVVTELNILAKSLDSTRYTVAATNEEIPSNSVPDLISWNLYFGWYYKTIPDFSKFIDDKHSFNPDRVIGVSEYGAGASIQDHEEIPAEPIADGYYHPEEYQEYFHEEHWKSIIQRSFIWASSIWAGFDFASDARDEGDYLGINDKGLITRDRLVKKDAYFFYKATWSSSPVVYITSRRYNERTQAITSAKVYSNSDSVKLLVNNKSYGYLKSSDHIFIKNIVLTDGPNMVKALGIKNGLITRDSCIWYLNYVPVDDITVDAPALNASIGTAGENDWYRFQTSTAGTYTIQTYGSTDMYMYLYQSDKTTLIEEDDDDGAGYNSLISRSLSADTWYYVKLKAYSSSATGSYSIDVKRIIPEVTLIVDAPALNASIGTAGENDWYKFQTSTAGTYTIQTYGSTDVYMYLYQSDKTTLIEEDDDDGAGYNSLISRSLSADTWYYVKLKAYSSSATGSYSIDVKRIIPEVTLIVDAPALNASIGTAGENDWYKFQTSTAGTYTIQTYGSTDVYMYLYQSDKTTLIEEDDDDGAGYNSLISRSLSADTWYYVKLKAYSSSATGSYSIDVKRIIPEVTLIVDAPALNTSIGTAGENDWYKFQTSTAGTYTIQTYGSTDVYMYLYQSDKTTLIEEDDDDGAGYNSLISRSLSADTWYYVKLKAYSSSATGSYSIDVKRIIPEVTLIVDAPALNASIGTAGENDWYKFQTSTAGTYTIQTYGSTDMYMYLYQSDKTTLIEEDDDDGAGYNSLISRSLSADTWYYVKLKAYSSSATGSYSIDVKRIIPEVTLIVDAPALNASIGTAGENDWYKFQTSTAGTYTIQTYGSTDMYMYLYQSDKTTLIEEDDDDGAGYNSLISRSLSADTWYYVKLKAYSSSATGSYSIDVLSMGNIKSSVDPAPFGDTLVNMLIAYPNPVSGILYVESTSTKEETYTIDLFNPSGQLILNQRIEVIDGRFEIDMSDVSPGPYLLKIVTNKTVDIIRVIKN